MTGAGIRRSLLAALVALCAAGVVAVAQEATPRSVTGLFPFVGDREIFQPGTQPCTVPGYAPSCFHTDHTDDFDRKFHPSHGEIHKLPPLDQLAQPAHPVRAGELPVATDGTRLPKIEVVCASCHGGYDDPDTGEPAAYSPYDSWKGTMMAQAWRDPLARAAIAVANFGLTQAKIDFAEGEYNDGPRGQTGRTAGDFCIRCHSPIGWLEGNSLPADGSQIRGKQTDGVQCDFCHRMVNPLTHTDEVPSDYNVLQNLPESLLDPDVFVLGVPALHNGNFIVNRTGAKIGPYPDPNNQKQHPLDACDPASALGDCDSPTPTAENDPQENIDFVRNSQLCAVCHNVTNPILNRLEEDGTPVLVNGRKEKMPVERTYTEWYFSDFGPATKGDPNRPLDPDDTGQSCQSCHMMATSGYAANPQLPGMERRCITDDLVANDPSCGPDSSGIGVPEHTFVGGNTWAQDMIPLFFPDQAPLQPVFDAVQEKARLNLRSAARLAATLSGSALRVEVENLTGHKLPTGYPEGRRMWLNVVGYDAAGELVYESGAYDELTAGLTKDADLKIWQAKLGIKKPGKPVEESFHFVLNNVILKDNRIAPRGFDFAAAAKDAAVIVRAARDCAGYAAAGLSAGCDAFDFDGDLRSDGRDVVFYDLPPNVVGVKVALRYQVASKEYIDFLSDPANSGDYFDRFTAGLKLAWLVTGKAAPTEMACATVGTTPTGACVE